MFQYLKDNIICDLKKGYKGRWYKVYLGGIYLFDGKLTDIVGIADGHGGPGK